MLSRRYRLSLRQERGFFQKARRFSTKYFQCFYVIHEDSLELAVVVSKKVALLATERNFTRRKVFAALQDVVSTFSNCKIQLVFVAKKPVKALSGVELNQEITSILNEVCKRNA